MDLYKPKNLYKIYQDCESLDKFCIDCLLFQCSIVYHDNMHIQRLYAKRVFDYSGVFHMQNIAGSIAVCDQSRT